jgi:RNA polymerase sigma-70 factor (ECF subfamily)
MLFQEKDGPRTWSDRIASIMIYRYARRLVGKVGFKRSDVEDIEATLAVELIQRLPKYDPGKSSKFTFIKLIISHAISDLIRERSSKAHYARREVISLFSPIRESVSDEVHYGHAADQDDTDARLGKRDLTREEQEHLRIDVAEAIDSLPEDLRQVAELLKTESLAETVRILKTTQHAVRTAVKQIRAHFQAAGLQEYFQ